MEQRFYNAARDGNPSLLSSLLLEPGPPFNINYRNEGMFGRSALHAACYNGHHDVVLFLLKLPEIQVNLRNDLGYTPFLLACYSGMVEVVKLLLRDTRTEVNTADNSERTPLWRAADRGHVEVIRWMVALRGTELEVDMRGEGWRGNKVTVLEIAKEQGKLPVMELLQRFVANPAKVQHELKVELGLVDAIAA